MAQEDQKDQNEQKIDDIPASTDSTGAKVCTAMSCRVVQLSLNPNPRKSSAMLFFVAQEDQKDQNEQKIDDIPASMDSTGAKVCTAMSCRVVQLSLNPNPRKSSAMLFFVAQEDQKDQNEQKIDDIPASMDSTGAKGFLVHDVANNEWKDRFLQKIVF